MNRYIENAIREVVKTDKPEEFAQMNQTAILIAENVIEQMMKNAITASCFGVQGGDALFSIRLPAKGYLVGSESKLIVIKED